MTGTSIFLGYDRETLREQVDLLAAGRRLDELENQRSLAALTEKLALYRMVGRIDEAWLMANETVRQARFTGDRETLLAARIRRAQIQQYQGKLEIALMELSGCVDEAHTHDWALLEASALEHRGKSYFDKGDYRRALVDLEDAHALRERENVSAAQLEATSVGISVIREKIASNG
ncbi:hypothetical protein [Planctomonas psychrotolerans]|uniref:hypothetical protein n=1 Tax=Planctomonas psychrotolerans TaxID=2528712 RepID=UPI00123C54FA|nr:hypothetical protein [Planctomonas psychrotolerans]